MRVGRKVADVKSAEYAAVLNEVRVRNRNLPPPFATRFVGRPSQSEGRKRLSNHPQKHWQDSNGDSNVKFSDITHGTAAKVEEHRDNC